MNKIIAFVCLAVLLETAYSAVELQAPVDPPSKFAGQPGCYSPDLDIMLPLAVMYSPKQQSICKGYLCNSNGVTQIFSCGLIANNANCPVSQDLSKPYPDCCEQVNCP